MSEFLLSLLKLVGSVIPILTGFLYYIGRRFTESYYGTLGVPREALNLSVADYLFKSVRSWTFLIAIALTYLLFILWRNVFRRPKSVLDIPRQVTKRESKSGVWRDIRKTIIEVIKRPFKKGEPQLLMLFYFFYFMCGVLLIILMVLIGEPNFAAEAFTEILVLVYSMGLAWMIMTDQPTIDFVKARERLKKAFIACIIFVVIVSMQLLPNAIGISVGIIQGNPYKIERSFPSIKIIANAPLWNQDIEWVQQDGMFETQDRLILIFENNEGLFVKKITEEEISEVLTIKKISETYYIPHSNVEGLSINYTG